MKQLLSLFLLLLPCLAWAQYPSNGNQKITLGEQTTADGLIFRGVAATDTVRKPSIDTMGYMVLDTTTNIIWHYKKATSNAWLRLNLLPSDTASMLTNYYRSGRTGIIQASDIPTLNQNTTGSAATLTTSRTFQTNLASTSTASFNGSANVTPGVTGTLPVANGGTGATSLTPNNYLIRTNSSGIFDTAAIYEAGGKVGIGLIPEYKLHIGSPIATDFFQYTEDLTFKTSRFGIKVTNNYEKLLFNSYNIPMYLSSGLAGGSGGIIAFQTGNLGSELERMRIRSDGNVGIGTISPLALLNVMGTVRINSASAPDANYYLQLENSSSQKAKANAWDTYSDSRIKTNRQPIINAIDKINLLNPTYYNQHDSYVEDDLLNIDYNNSYKSLGFIAQEVYEVIPEAVNMGTTNELWAMDYTKLIPILTKAIQEQQALIKALEQRIINLENK
jgi:uncharacterized protein YqkB